MLAVDIEATDYTDEAEFRPINVEFLGKSGKEVFDIFYRTESFGTTKFIRFASSDPKHQEKVKSMMESGDSELELYIHEKDLFKYYRHATESLRSVIKSSAIPQQEKVEKIYEVSKGIMLEFFEYNASNKILASSEEVMDIMDSCMQQHEMGFYAIAQITNKDYYTYTHSVNVGLYCMTFAVKLGLKHDDAKQLGLGGMLHDVGKSKIPLELINKDGKLTDEEFDQIKTHSPLGQEMLEELNCYANKVISMAGQHHEKYKGGGYPQGLVGDEISMYARICKIMDVYDALTTRRTYKKPMAAFDALTLMKKQMEPEFDPILLTKFIQLMGPDL